MSTTVKTVVLYNYVLSWFCRLATEDNTSHLNLPRSSGGRDTVPVNAVHALRENSNLKDIS